MQTADVSLAPLYALSFGLGLWIVIAALMVAFAVRQTRKYRLRRRRAAALSDLAQMDAEYL